MLALKLELPKTITRINDRKFQDLCQKNPESRIERTSEGDIVIMAPTGGETGKRNFLLAVKIGFSFFGAWMLQSLLRLYQQGILFTARNVWYIRVLGYYVIIDWLINYQMEGVARATELHTTQLLVGLLVIFIAWIMDEGRKIQEEQELTV